MIPQILALLTCTAPLALSQIVVNPPRPVKYEMQIQLVRVRNDQGVAAAFPDTEPKRELLLRETNRCLAQVGVRAVFKPGFKIVQSGAIYDGGTPDNQVRPGGFNALTEIFDLLPDGIYDRQNSHSTVLFIDHIPEQRDSTAAASAGLADRGGNRALVAFQDNYFNSTRGREGTARVFAHEILHNLGLEHLEEVNNIMVARTASTQARLNDDQFRQIMDSRFRFGLLSSVGFLDVKFERFRTFADFSWMRQVGDPESVNYRFESSTSLKSDDWKDETSLVRIKGNGRLTGFFYDGGRRFYRITRIAP